MTWKYRYRKQIIIVFIVLSVIGVAIFYFLNRKEKTKKEKPILLTEQKETKSKKKISEKTETKKIMIDLKGEIVNPGIYILDENSRVIDAINMAGGTTNNADTSVLNLSKKLKDEMVIIVYSYAEVKEFSKIKEVEKQVQNACQSGVNGITNDACNIEENKTQTSSNQTISINTATKEELMTLPGIGEKKAEDIIKYREENGEFKSIEDIQKVNGIGESLFAKIKENITL